MWLRLLLWQQSLPPVVEAALHFVSVVEAALHFVSVVEVAQ
jgi:hypothetical protein